MGEHGRCSVLMGSGGSRSRVFRACPTSDGVLPEASFSYALVKPDLLRGTSQVHRLPRGAAAGEGCFVPADGVFGAQRIGRLHRRLPGRRIGDVGMQDAVDAAGGSGGVVKGGPDAAVVQFQVVAQPGGAWPRRRLRRGPSR